MNKTTLTRAGKLPFSRGLRGAVAMACCVSFLGALEASAQTWNGGSATGSNWSDAANWTGGVAPASGNTTALTFSGSARLSPNMDTDFTVKSLTISGTSSFDFMGAHTLTFDSHAAAGNATVFTNSDASAQTIESNIVVDNTGGSTGVSYLINGGGSLTMSGSVMLTTATYFRADPNTTTTISGALSGAGTFHVDSNTANSGGTIIFSGTTANTNTGNSALGNGQGVTLELNKSAGVTALSGTAFFVGPGDTLKLDNDEQILSTLQLRLIGGTFLMQGHSATAGSLILDTGNTNSVLDFGSGSQKGLTLTGAASTWTAGTLTIDNWNGTDYLRAASAPSASFLANTTFNGYAAGATDTLTGGYYYITPLAVPEPGQAALMGAGGLLALAAWVRMPRGRESAAR